MGEPYNEFFGYGQQTFTPRFPMDAEEIHVAPGYEHGAYYNGHAQYNEPRQFYFGEHDRRRNHNHNDRGDQTPNVIPFPIDGREELPRHQRTVQIRLSVNPRSIDTNGLSSAFSTWELRGKVLTVTGYPPRGYNDAAHDFLTIVKECTGDYRASLA